MFSESKAEEGLLVPSRLRLLRNKTNSCSSLAWLLMGPKFMCRTQILSVMVVAARNLGANSLTHLWVWNPEQQRAHLDFALTLASSQCVLDFFFFEKNRNSFVWIWTTRTKEINSALSHKDLLSHQRDSIWKVLLEEVQHIAARWKSFKLLKGHEQGACERFVLRRGTGWEKTHTCDVGTKGGPLNHRALAGTKMS